MASPGGIHVVRFWVTTLLSAAGYELPANRKPRKGLQPPDRNAQFRISTNP